MSPARRSFVLTLESASPRSAYLSQLYLTLSSRSTMNRLAKRFWAKVDKDGPTVTPHLGPCWVWTADTAPNGYGRIKVNGQSVNAHRVGWALQFGEPGVGLYVLHRCDNRLCVRGEHLFLGTQKDNVHDCAAKGRRVNPTGERHGRSKLSNADASKVRSLVSRGLPQSEVARRFGVTPSCVSRIVTGARRKKERACPGT